MITQQTTQFKLCTKDYITTMYPALRVSPSQKLSSVQLLSRVQLFATPWTAACHASLSITNSQSLLKLMSIESVMPSKHLIPRLLPPSIFPSIRVFSYESALLIKWPKYCSFNFSISPSSEYSGFISFRIDYSTGLSRVFSNTIAIYFHAYNIFKMTNFSNEGQIRGCQGLEVGVGVGCQTVTWGSLGYEMFNSLTVLVSWT